ncbi:L-threonylcarbamoyladenylate synthase [Ferrimonas balearica]|uniref:L-threonylcarbamoyladenylate synthase n=1 Tax=Ferrimonas balearica TaxID=44012 RepID=UPI001C9A0EF0|nr:L-threonylcarbamoyladenylate synthase [Ferrimonas balearica]MBY5994188.1 threonylcarbamoyl-AMP synthase [Ferrimonas balearica]
MSRLVTINQAAQIIAEGGVVAYPTEAVFGLGCDPRHPDAVQRLLAIKQRPVEKGLILIAASYGQLLPYVDDTALTPQRRRAVLSRWPGPTTWVMPAKASVPDWVTGQFESLAVRVTEHPVAADLCCAFGAPLVSTSANLTGEPPARTADEVLQALGDRIDGVVIGDVGGRESPSTILDALTEQVLRS